MFDLSREFKKVLEYYILKVFYVLFFYDFVRERSKMYFVLCIGVFNYLEVI